MAKPVICYVVVSHGLDCSSSLVDPEISTGKMSDVMSFHIRLGKAATTPFSFGVAELHSGLLLPNPYRRLAVPLRKWIKVLLTGAKCFS